VHTPTPGLPEFDYIKPASLAEASKFLAQYSGEARPFMGGTDTFVRMRDGFWKEKYIVDVKNLDGMSQISFEFFRGPGKTVLKPGDIATAILFPIPPKNYAARYIKLGRNAIGDLAIVGVTALGYPDSSAPAGFRFRLALASVAPVPFRPIQAETILAETPITEATIVEAAQAAMDACTPIDDVRGSARYRKLMVRNLTKRAITEVWRAIKK
jgi:CO/xanthine dehydrogenase FAD-binding subunit